MGVPIIDIQGNVGPEGISRPKHKRTFTGFTPQEIKSVEGSFYSWSMPQETICSYDTASIGSKRPPVMLSIHPIIRRD